MFESTDILSWLESGTIEGLTLLVIIALATLITEDLTCICAGLLVTQKMLPLFEAISACVAGILLGDILLYLLGRCIAESSLHRQPLKWIIKESAIRQSTEWFEHRGPAVVILSRFLPGTRLPTYVSAGILKMPFLKFTGYFLIAVLLWTPILVTAGMVLGNVALNYFEVYTTYALPAFIAAALMVLLIVKLIVPMFTYSGRRLLLSSWRRTVRWEFWPPWVFYPPIALYVLYLGIKHRSLTLFTASNPAIPTSGFIGESKVDILDGIKGANEFIASYVLVSASDETTSRMVQIETFMKNQQLDYPIALKPNIGQRGTAVVIAHSTAAVQEYVSAADWDIVVQAFAPGDEFGVFYYRYPNEEHGHIFSITEKQFPTLTGDEKYTLQRLILSDDRAVCMARFYIDKHHDRIFDVPEKGEQIPLVDIGTHCRGALFLDGAWIHTPEMEKAFDDISKKFDGFYFGRYDVRTPSVDDFKQGRNFKIVELNGVTAEATHIYDPKHSVWNAYRTLMKQWRIAFEIGEQNKRNGAAPIRVRELFSLLTGYKNPSIEN